MTQLDEVQTAEEAVRTARVQWRQRQLVAAAARLLEREGYTGMSMQALAREAGVSVGSIYRYFSGKEDVLLTVIVDVLDALSRRVPAAMAAVGEDPVEQVAAGFRSYCEVIDEHRHAAMLTYRESRWLGEDGRERIKRLEVATSEPLRDAVQAGVHSGVLDPDLDADLFAYDLLLLAHAWALKHWYFERGGDLPRYVTDQTALVLGGAILPQHRWRYRHLLRPEMASKRRRAHD